jgi:hypothetical protein
MGERRESVRSARAWGMIGGRNRSSMIGGYGSGSLLSIGLDLVWA